MDKITAILYLRVWLKIHNYVGIISYICRYMAVCVCHSNNRLMSHPWVFDHFQIGWWQLNGGDTGDFGHGRRRWAGQWGCRHGRRCMSGTIWCWIGQRRWSVRCNCRCNNDNWCCLLSRCRVRWSVDIFALMGRVCQFLQDFVEIVIFVAVFTALQMLIVHGYGVEKDFTFCT